MTTLATPACPEVHPALLEVGVTSGHPLVLETCPKLCLLSELVT